MDEPLVFVGRLRRQEVRSLALHRFIENRAKRYAYSALLIPVVGLLVLNLAALNRLPWAWQVGSFLAVFGVGFVARYAVAASIIFVSAHDQDQDARLSFDRHAVTIGRDGRTLSFDYEAVKLSELPGGLVGVVGRVPVFMLPHRVTTPVQRTAIERLFHGTS